MPRYQRHVFVCVNERPEGHPKGCCAAKGSGRVRELLKQGLKTRGLNRIVRANAAGCLDACEYGATVAVYPEGVWYGGVTESDVEEIIDRHVVRGEVVERLLIPRYDAGARTLPPLGPAAPAPEAPRPHGIRPPEKGE